MDRPEKRLIPRIVEATRRYGTRGKEIDGLSRSEYSESGGPELLLRDRRFSVVFSVGILFGTRISRGSLRANVKENQEFEGSRRRPWRATSASDPILAKEVRRWKNIQPSICSSG